MSLEAAVETLSAKLNQPSEATDWFEMTQERVNTFADATMDHQWIHVDPERATAGPFGAPIAHGQLTHNPMQTIPSIDIRTMRALFARVFAYCRLS